MEQRQQTFWDHLDDLRSVLLRTVVAIAVVASLAFCFKDQLFGVIFAAQSGDFITFRLLDTLSSKMGAELSLDFNTQLINTQLAQQFTTHITVALWSGFLLVFPYILFELFRFVSPALYSSERSYATRVVAWGYVMFLLGVALSYFVIFPLTFRFLATYQVSTEVVNMIALDSYIGTLITLSLMVGILFEMPILCWFFAKLGLLSASFMRGYRRHAVVILLLIAAVITPTADVVTLLLVALPIYLLYEVSIILVSSTSPR